MRQTLPQRPPKATDRPVTTSNDREVTSRHVDDHTVHLLTPRVLLAACGDEANGLRILCQTFQTYAPLLTAEVDDALRGRNAPQLRLAAHKLCGILMAFSSIAADVASTIENYAVHGRLLEAGPLVKQLAILVRELKHELDGLSLESLRRQ